MRLFLPAGLCRRYIFIPQIKYRNSMKRIFRITIPAVLFILSSVYHDSEPSSENRKKVPIIVTTTRKTPPVQRFDFRNLSVFMDDDRKDI